MLQPLQRQGERKIDHLLSVNQTMSVRHAEVEMRVQDTADLIIVGSAAIDITAQAETTVENALIMHSTAPGSVSISAGGVARNIAEAANRVISANSPELSSLLVSAVGNDQFGHLLVEEMRKVGMRTDGLVQSNKRTPTCSMVLDSHGSLIGGVADMEATIALNEDEVGFPQHRKHRPH
jgi:pseudouridine-5'-phosphate glycosidase/pseudouridine kinase